MSYWVVWLINCGAGLLFYLVGCFALYADVVGGFSVFRFRIQYSLLRESYGRLFFEMDKFVVGFLLFNVVVMVKVSFTG